MSSKAAASRRFFIDLYGCAKNQVDAEEIATRLEAAGLAVEEKVGHYRLRYRLYERLRL